MIIHLKQDMKENQICDELKLYSYLTPINYQGILPSSFNTQEIEIRPSVENKELLYFGLRNLTR
jgi:hypothetical protein